MQKLLDEYFPANDIPRLNDSYVANRPKGFYLGALNRHNYRSDEFDDRGDFNIAYLGCSWVEASGVARDHMFSEVVSRELSRATGKSVRSWNFGMSGAGLDHVMRLAPMIVSRLRPDLIVLVVTAPERREFFAENGRFVQFTYSMTKNHKKKVFIPDWMEPIVEAFDVLHNDNNEAAYLLRNIRALECMFDSAEIPWLYSWIDRPIADIPMTRLWDHGALPSKPFLGHKFEEIDKSNIRHETEINLHPGPKSHDQFGRSIAMRILSDRLTKKRGFLRNMVRRLGSATRPG